MIPDIINLFKQYTNIFELISNLPMSVQIFRILKQGQSQKHLPQN